MIFKSMNYVPPRLRKLKGVALSKEQVEIIVGRACELSSDPSDFAVALAKAREEFMDVHEKGEGVWIVKGGE